MEEDLQETNSSSDKKASFLNKPISTKMLIIVACSLVVCFLLGFLLFSFISDNSKPKGHSFNSRPSINDPRRPPNRDQRFDQRHHPGERPFGERPQMQNPERRQQDWGGPQRRRGMFSGEVSDEEHRRHMMERIAHGEYVDPEEFKGLQEVINQQNQREEQNKKQPPERERPKLND